MLSQRDVAGRTGGVVIIQIDGLAHPILAHQIRAGRVPFIASWVRHRTMQLDRWTALLPSQTSASQAGILHGNNGFIPAFRWWEKDQRQRSWSRTIPRTPPRSSRRASDGEGLLSATTARASAISSPATPCGRYITMATIKDGATASARASLLPFFVSPDNYLHDDRAVDRRDAEGVLPGGAPARPGSCRHAPWLALSHRPRRHERRPAALGDGAGHGGDVPRHAGHLHRLHRLRRDRPPLRPGASRDARCPRRRGQDDRARWSRRLATTPRPYRFVLLSDHGQSLGATFLQRYGETLQDVVAELMGAAPRRSRRRDLAGGGPWGQLNAFLSERHGRRRDGRRHAGDVPDADDRRPGRRDAAWSGRRDDAGRRSTAPPARRRRRRSRPELVVCASGNLGAPVLPAAAGPGHAGGDRGAAGRASCRASPAIPGSAS